MSGNFLVSVINFLFLKWSSSFKAIDKNVQNAGQTEINQAIFKTATIVARSSDGPGANVNLRKLWLTLA